MKLLALRFFAFAAVLGLAAPAAAADPARLTIALIPSESAAQAYYAQDLGFFKAAGLDVTLMPFPASPPIITAVSSGSAEIGNSVVGSVVAGAFARHHGEILRAGRFVSRDLADRASRGPQGHRDAHRCGTWRGKTVAVTGLADLTFYATKQWVEQTGGNPESMKFIELPEPEMVHQRSRRIASMPAS